MYPARIVPIRIPKSGGIFKMNHVWILNRRINSRQNKHPLGNGICTAKISDHFKAYIIGPYSRIMINTIMKVRRIICKGRHSEIPMSGYKGVKREYSGNGYRGQICKIDIVYRTYSVPLKISFRVRSDIKAYF